MTHIQLKNAYFCSDCFAITDNARSCTLCGSTAVMGLWRFIHATKTSARLHRTAQVLRKPNSFYRPQKFDAPVSIAS